MSNDVQKKNSGALAAAAALKQNLQTVQNQMPANSNSQYLRMLTDGDWVFGADNVEVKPDWELAINPLSIMMGWSCWSNNSDPTVKNEILGEEMVPLGQPIPAKTTLPDHGFPWKEQIGFQLRVMDGKHKGKQLEYKTNSVGGLAAVRGVIDEILRQLEDDPEYIVPVVNLSSDHYDHKKWGRTYTPVIDIVAFTDMEDTKGGEPETKPEPAPEPKAEEKPAPRRRRAAAKEEEKPEPEIKEDVEDAEVVEEEQPVRRRRRRA